MTYTLHLGDCLDVLKTLPDASVDAVVTDPPYELGFMGKKWDAAGIAYSVPLWTEALRVLKPGGHLLAFGGTRTYHRMACAIEDAGFEVRDSLHWIYGSGFPKSLNLDGDHKGWGTALKPAHEPVVVARKPLVGTVAANVLEHGTGALNIDGCRVAATDKTPAPVGQFGGSRIGPTGHSGYRDNSSDQLGRWPPNILLSHTPECGESCAENCAVAEMDRQSGPAGSNSTTSGSKGGSAVFGGAVRIGGQTHDTRASGGASRFFPVFKYQAKASRSERERGLDDRDKRQAQKWNSGGIAARRSETAKPLANVHPTVKPVELMRWLVRLVTPPNGVVLDPFTGSGTTGVAAMLEGFHFVGIEREPEYHAIATARIDHATRQGTQLELSA
jgi:DNA modification methylase